MCITIINRVLFLYDMDNFTSPPTLPEVGLDGLVSEKKYTIISSVICVRFHQYYINCVWGKNTSLRQSPVCDFISSSLIIGQGHRFKRFLHSLVRTNLEV